MAQLRQEYEQFVTRDAEIVAVGPDSEKAFQDYWHKENLPFVGLADPTHSVARRYGQEVKLLKLGRMPALLVVDKGGRVTYAHYGGSTAHIRPIGEILDVLDGVYQDPAVLMLRVMADWGSSGIWKIGRYGPFRHAMITPKKLGLPRKLGKRFQAWIVSWQQRAMLSDPECEHMDDTGVPDYEQINEEGRLLARALKQHFGPKARIFFAPDPLGDGEFPPEEEIFE